MRLAGYGTCQRGGERLDLESDERVRRTGGTTSALWKLGGGRPYTNKASECHVRCRGGAVLVLWIERRVEGRNEERRARCTVKYI